MGSEKLMVQSPPRVAGKAQVGPSYKEEVLRQGTKGGKCEGGKEP